MKLREKGKREFENQLFFPLKDCVVCSEVHRMSKALGGFPFSLIKLRSSWRGPQSPLPVCWLLKPTAHPCGQPGPNPVAHRHEPSGREVRAWEDPPGSISPNPFKASPAVPRNSLYMAFQGVAATRSQRKGVLLLLQF